MAARPKLLNFYISIVKILYKITVSSQIPRKYYGSSRGSNFEGFYLAAAASVVDNGRHFG